MAVSNDTSRPCRLAYAFKSQLVSFDPTAVRLSLEEQGVRAIIEASAPEADLTELTLREKEVLSYLRQGLTNREIAYRLYISINTVNTHIRNIYSKLGAHDRSSAVQRARELRLISTRLSRPSTK